MPQVQIDVSKKFDYVLASITLVVIAAIVSVLLNLTGSISQHELLNPVKHYSTIESLTLEQLPPDTSPQWESVVDPVNMGMDSNEHWFIAPVAGYQTPYEHYMLEVNYALMDTLDV